MFRHLYPLFVVVVTPLVIIFVLVLICLHLLPRPIAFTSCLPCYHYDRGVISWEGHNLSLWELIIANHGMVLYLHLVVGEDLVMANHDISSNSLKNPKFHLCVPSWFIFIVCFLSFKIWYYFWPSLYLLSSLSLSFVYCCHHTLVCYLYPHPHMSPPSPSPHRLHLSFALLLLWVRWVISREGHQWWLGIIGASNCKWWHNTLSTFGSRRRSYN